MSKTLRNKISEYFLGTDIIKQFNRMISEIVEIDTCREYLGIAHEDTLQRIKSERNYRNFQLFFSKYLPNAGDVLSIGAFGAYLATGSPNLTWSIAGLAGSEFLRNIIRKGAKESNACMEESLKVERLYVEAKSAARDLAEETKYQEEDN